MLNAIHCHGSGHWSFHFAPFPKPVAGALPGIVTQEDGSGSENLHGRAHGLGGGSRCGGALWGTTMKTSIGDLCWIRTGTIRSRQAEADSPRLASRSLYNVCKRHESVFPDELGHIHP